MTDAGFGTQGAIAAILEMMPTELLATFNADEFILATLPYPVASAALVEALATVAGLEFATGELHTERQLGRALMQDTTRE